MARRARWPAAEHGGGDPERHAGQVGAGAAAAAQLTAAHLSPEGPGADRLRHVGAGEPARLPVALQVVGDGVLAQIAERVSGDDPLRVQGGVGGSGRGGVERRQHIEEHPHPERAIGLRHRDQLRPGDHRRPALRAAGDAHRGDGVLARLRRAGGAVLDLARNRALEDRQVEGPRAGGAGALLGVGRGSRWERNEEQRGVWEQWDQCKSKALEQRAHGGAPELKIVCVS